MNWEAWKPLATLIFTSVLKFVGGLLVAHGLATNGPGLEALGGAATTAAGAFWSWWVQKGHIQAADYLKKLTDTATTAAAVAVAKKMAPAAATGAAADAHIEVAADTGTTVPKAPIIMFTIAIALSLAFHGDARAQAAPLKLKPPQLTGDVVADTKANLGIGQQTTASGVRLTGDPIVDLQAAITKGGQKLIMNLKQSYALAVAKNAAGSSADNTSATCTKALVPIFDLVVNGPKPGTIAADDPMALTSDEQAMASDAGQPEGVIVKVQKIRILRLALQSPALNDACGALVQDEVKNAQNLIGKITSLVTGAGMAGIGL